MRPLTALAAVLLVAGPWFAAVAVKTQGEFLTGFFGVHHFHRFTASMDNHAGPFWFYPAAICIGFFPWIIFLSPSIFEFRRRVQEGCPTRSADILICSWFVVWVGFFSLATTKFPHYVVPAYPALALFTACFLDRWTRHAEIYGPVARNAAWGTVAVAGLGILIIVPIVADLYLQGEPFLGLAGWPLLAGAALCAYFTQRRQITRALVCLTASAILFLVAVFGVAAVQVDRHQNTIPFAETIHRHAPAEGARIATFGYFRPGLVYYCNERVEPLGEASTAAQFLQQNPRRGFLVTTEAAYVQMANTLPPQIGVLDRGPWFLKSGQTLLLLGAVSGDDKDRQTVSDHRKTAGQRRE
jgi:4-amino-4-deoxy-L-arabinose transferase-like glycosyltransferase